LLPDPQEADIALARFLMPQLQRAVALRQRLQKVDMLASAALSALDILRHAILLLDQNGRVLHANVTGETMLREADVLGARHGVLFGATQSLTNRLHAVLARAAGLGGPPARAGVLRLWRRHAGDETLALLAMPFRQEACWSQFQRPSILVRVTDPASGPAPPAEQLIELFGLTGAEAALAADLLAGHELRRIAEIRGRSLNTVRTHLGKLMAKTNVNRQSDLMRLLAGLPRVRDTD
jgi:DNA-binding CsgD family transcriptional regulator